MGIIRPTMARRKNSSESENSLDTDTEESADNTRAYSPETESAESAIRAALASPDTSPLPDTSPFPDTDTDSSSPPEVGASGASRAVRGEGAVPVEKVPEVLAAGVGSAAGKRRGRPPGSKNAKVRAPAEAKAEWPARPEAAIVAIDSDTRNRALADKILMLAPSLVGPITQLAGPMLQAIGETGGLDLANSRTTIFVNAGYGVMPRRLDTDGISAFTYPIAEIVAIVGPDVLNHPAIVPMFTILGLGVGMGMAMRSPEARAYRENAERPDGARQDLKAATFDKTLPAAVGA